MFLWVWDDCFIDYTKGLAVVLAPTVEEARKLLTAKIGYDHSDVDTEPKRYELTEPIAFYVHGGS